MGAAEFCKLKLTHKMHFTSVATLPTYVIMFRLISGITQAFRIGAIPRRVASIS